MPLDSPKKEEEEEEGRVEVQDWNNRKQSKIATHTYWRTKSKSSKIVDKLLQSNNHNQIP